MKTSNKKYSTSMSLFYLILYPWTILALVLGVFDLSISKNIVDFNSPLGTFGEIWGDLPGYGLLGIAASIIVSGHLQNINKQKIGSLLIILIGGIFCVFGFLLESLKILLVGMSIALPTIIFTFFTIKKDWRKYFTIALVIGLLALLNSLIFIHTLKIIWGRVRYYDLITLGDSFYTPWFLPVGPSIENTSFPSGHTTMAFLFLPLLILIKKAKWNMVFKIGLSLIIFAWGFLISFSRVLYGTHYATDVLFSTGFTALFAIILYQFVYLKKDILESKMNYTRTN